MTVIRQRADGDCGVAALATLASLAYEDVYAVIARIDRVTHGKSGLHNREIIAAARRLNIRLAPTRRYDLDADNGILRIRWNGPKGQRNPGGHFVAVREGFILCPTDTVPMDWRDYLAVYEGRACTLLRELD